MLRIRAPHSERTASARWTVVLASVGAFMGSPRSCPFPTRRGEAVSTAVAETSVRDPQPALAATS
jgi:hypothetical protein